jgi:lysophospholipase L1-like esterase
MGALKQLWNLSGGLDIDAKAYITAAGLTDSTQILSINNFVKGLKEVSLWNKMYAIYPFIGGTAATHKWNLKDSRDLDAAFRLTFNGAAATHNQYGIDWPAVATINANTHFNPSADPYNFGMTAYIGNNIDQGYIMGNFNGSASANLQGGGRKPTGSIYNVSPYAVALPTPLYSLYNIFGVVSLNRTSNVYSSIYRNGIKMGSNTATESASVNAIIFLNNVTSNFSAGNSRMQFAAIHQGLTDSENVIFSTLINNMQTSLSRSYDPSLTTYNYLGDSITWGQASSFSNSWAQIIAISKSAYSYNLGYPGYDSTNIINLSLPLLPNKTSKDKYVFLAIGINDISSMSSTQYNTNMHTIVNTLITKGYDNTNIIIPTIYWNQSATVPTYNTIISDIWTEYNLSIKPDVYTAMLNGGTSSLLHPDGVHLNTAGHLLAGNTILAAMP